MILPRLIYLTKLKHESNPQGWSLVSGAGRRSLSSVSSGTITTTRLVGLPQVVPGFGGTLPS
jgi:hypothetical protein